MRPTTSCRSAADRAVSILRRFGSCRPRTFHALGPYSSRAPISVDAPEADMACRGVDRLSMARGRTIAAAIVGCAQMRAAFEHLAWYLDVRLTRVVARGLESAARIFRNAARLRCIRFVLLRIPIARPLPDIADHVVNAVAVGRECDDGRGSLEAVRAKILARKFALPGIRHVLTARCQLIAPGELSAIEAAACGEFPLGLGR